MLLRSRAVAAHSQGGTVGGTDADKPLSCGRAAWYEGNGDLRGEFYVAGQRLGTRN